MFITLRNVAFLLTYSALRVAQSTTDLPTVVSDSITKAFNRPRATKVEALDISTAFNRVWYAGLLHELISYGVSGRVFGLISSFLRNRRLQVVLDGKSLQEYPINAEVPQGSTLGPTLFLLYIDELRNDVTCNIAIYADDTTFHSKCDQAIFRKVYLFSTFSNNIYPLLGPLL